jgi:hypothetical protein
MKLIILILATLMALITVSVGDYVEVGPVIVGVDLSAFKNANITQPDTTSPPFAVTDYDNYWFKEYRATIRGDENKTIGLVFREFGNDVLPNNYLTLYDMGVLDQNHYNNSFIILANWIIFNPDGTPAGVLIYSDPYPDNNSHTFLTYWLSNRHELIFTSKNLTCEELNLTINSIYIEGHEKNKKFLDINMHCS